MSLSGLRGKRDWSVHWSASPDTAPLSSHESMQEESGSPCSAAEVCVHPLSVQGCESTQEKAAVAGGQLSISRSSSCDDSTSGSASQSPKSRAESVEGAAVFGFPPVAQGALRPQLTQPFAFRSVAQGALRSTSISTRVRVRSASSPYQRSSSMDPLPPFALPQQERQPPRSPRLSALAAAEAAAKAVQWTAADVAAEAAERAAALAAVNLDAARVEADIRAMLVGNLFALASADLPRPCYAQ